MKHHTPFFTATLLAAALSAHAADMAPATSPQAKPANSPPAQPANKPGGNTPKTSSSGSGLSDGSNTGTQVKPKIPKCPDPTDTACKAVQVPATK